MEAVAQGKDPKGIIRDPEVAKSVALPIATPEMQRDGITTAQWKTDPYFSRRSRRFPWQYGQPAEVWHEYAAAMGVNPEERDPTETKPV
jgi:5,5'-dehydrodivanillate O-demethylase